ncbi:MAG: Lrp/AsnC family transcriptional regulator [Promethearchaeota archaeon]
MENDGENNDFLSENSIKNDQEDKNKLELFADKKSENNRILAYCLLKLKPQRLEDVLKFIKDLKFIKHYSVLTGDYDGLLEIEVENLQQLYELFIKIDKIEGIIETQTHVVLKKFTFN